METKLILIEGIPGSGKSTIARKIAGWYEERSITVNLYIEGQSHPADLGWNACVPPTEYGDILRRYGELREDIEKHTVFEGDTAIVAYTQVKTGDRVFYDDMERYEVYDGRVTDEVFYNLHYGRWRAFAAAAAVKDELNIFECAFLQNHVNELVFWRNADEGEVIKHHNRLLEAVEALSPVLIYLSQPDIRETIGRIARERVSAEYGDWIDKCIAYCENSPYGKRNKINGYDGAIEFFLLRKRLEMKIIDQLPIPHAVIDNPDYDWDAVWASIVKYLTQFK